jgi:hypothetical protein
MLSALLLVVGGVGAGWSLRTALTRRRPLDLLGALLAPLFLVAALVGALSLLVPGFLR